MQLEVLSKLPGVISGSHTDEDLGALLSRLLLDAVPPAEAVAVAHFDETRLPKNEASIDSFPKPLTLRVETRENFTGRFSPSRKILLRALKEQTSVMHIWEGKDDEEGGGFTVSEGLGWAFCAPICGESSQGWRLYVSGKGTSEGGLIVTEDDLAGDLRFTELVAQFIGSIRNVRLLQEQKAQLSSFTSHRKSSKDLPAMTVETRWSRLRRISQFCFATCEDSQRSPNNSRMICCRYCGVSVQPSTSWPKASCNATALLQIFRAMRRWVPGAGLAC